MKINDNGVYVTVTNGEDRFVPWPAYKKVEEGVRNLIDNKEMLPGPVRWLLRKSLRNTDTAKHVELSLQGIINSVEELGGKIEWQEV